MIIGFIIMGAYTEEEPLLCNLLRHFSYLNPDSNLKNILILS